MIAEELLVALFPGALRGAGELIGAHAVEVLALHTVKVRTECGLDGGIGQAHAVHIDAVGGERLVVDDAHCHLGLSSGGSLCRNELRAGGQDQGGIRVVPDDDFGVGAGLGIG